MVPFIVLYKVVHTFKYLDETLQCNRSSESCYVDLFITFHKVVIRSTSVGETPVCGYSNENTLRAEFSSIFLD